MLARITRSAKGATQSGAAQDQEWLLEYTPASRSEVEPLMGWTGSSDTLMQVKIRFDSRQEAVAFAERNGIAYRVEEQTAPGVKIKAYSDNFRYNRVGLWTH